MKLFNRSLGLSFFGFLRFGFFLLLLLTSLCEEIIAEKLNWVFGAMKGCGFHGWLDEGQDIFFHILVSG